MESKLESIIDFVGHYTSVALSKVNGPSVLEVGGGRDMWWEQMNMLLTFQSTLWNCWMTGLLGVFWAEDNGQLFWQCMYEFTNQVDWFIPIRDYQVNMETGEEMNKEFYN